MRSASGGESNRASSVLTTSAGYSAQLSIFVVFDKKAGWIRLADAAVGEMEFYDDGSFPLRHSSNSASNSNTHRKSRISIDSHNSFNSLKWIPLVECEIPVAPTALSVASTKKVYLLTRGTQTHILPSPLPVNSASTPPMRIIAWKAPPSHVSPRVCAGSDDTLPYLQLTALGERSVEVQEISLSFLAKGKGKARVEEPIHIEEDAGGDTGFLCSGGHWDHPHVPYQNGLSRSYSALSTMSGQSFESVDTDDIRAKLRQEEGIYGWCRRGLSDWRVFWLGGSLTDDLDDEQESM